MPCAGPSVVTVHVLGAKQLTPLSWPVLYGERAVLHLGQLCLFQKLTEVPCFPENKT